MRFALTITVCLALAGCVTPGKYQEALDERDALQAEVDNLKVRNRSLQSRIAFVNEQIIDEGAVIEAQQAVIETQAEALAAVQGVYGALVDVFAVETSNGTVVIVAQDDVVVMNVSAEVLFPSGSAELDPGALDIMSRVAKALEGLPFQVVVGGYTDDQPIGPALAARYPTNWELGAARASRVVRDLAANGIAESRLVAVSFGPTQPVASNDTAEGRAQNRRIELHMSPIVAGS